jgi:hypothetical protein
MAILIVVLPLLQYGTSMYIDSHNTILGSLTERFKYNVCASTNRRRRNAVIQLGNTKPEMVEVTGSFITAMSGTVMPASGFVYDHPTGMLRMYNLTPATGIIEDESVAGDEAYAIPIDYVARESIILTNIYPKETPL